MSLGNFDSWLISQALQRFESLGESRSCCGCGVDECWGPESKTLLDVASDYCLTLTEEKEAFEGAGFDFSLDDYENFICEECVQLARKALKAVGK